MCSSLPGFKYIAVAAVNENVNLDDYCLPSEKWKRVCASPIKLLGQLYKLVSVSLIISL